MQFWCLIGFGSKTLQYHEANMATSSKKARLNFKIAGFTARDLMWGGGGGGAKIA